MSDSTQDTAKWSVSERLRLADSLARIEESLKRQDEHLDDLVDHAKFARAKIEKLGERVQSAHNRLSLHEKIVGTLISAGGIVAGVWQFFHD